MMMKKAWLGIISIAVVASVGSLTPMPAEARASYMSDHDFGLGLILGSPTAVSVKYMFNDTSALDGGVGLGFLGGSHLHVHADYVHHIDLTRHRYFDLYLTLGGGLRSSVWFDEGGPRYFSTEKRKKQKAGFGLGFRAKTGLNFALRMVPVEVFLEVAPGLGVIPYIGGFVDGGLGARYYF